MFCHNFLDPIWNNIVRKRFCQSFRSKVSRSYPQLRLVKESINNPMFPCKVPSTKLREELLILANLTINIETGKIHLDFITDNQRPQVLSITALQRLHHPRLAIPHRNRLRGQRHGK